MAYYDNRSLQARGHNKLPESVNEGTSATAIAAQSMSVPVEREPSPASGRGRPDLGVWVARSYIRHGIPLASLASDAGHLRFAQRCVAVAATPIAVELMPVSDTIVTATASPAEAILMRLGFAKPAAASLVPWLALLGELETEQATTIRVVGRQVHTRIAVHMELADLEPHADFVRDVEAVFALAAAQQLEALCTALQRWGAVFATRVELGCALSSTTTFPLSTNHPIAGSLYHADAPTLRKTEAIMHNSLQMMKTGAAFGANDAEKAAYLSMSRQTKFRVVGGTGKMHMEQRIDLESIEQEDGWAIVGVSGVHPVLGLLQRQHPQLFDKAKKLIAAASRTTSYGAVKSPWPYT